MQMRLPPPNQELLTRQLEQLREQIKMGTREKMEGWLARTEMVA